MNLVFQADGLSVGEGAFLMACCNHTDAKGYVIASMQQLADEAHLKESAAKSNKQKLIQRGLLASSERYSPKNGARIADLYRVNLELLASMKRARTDYGPTLVEELTFKVPKENRRSDPPSDSGPLLLPFKTPSSLSPLPEPADCTRDVSSDGEREIEAPPEKQDPNLSEAELPQQRERSGKDAAARDRIVASYAAALGRPVLNGTRSKLERQALDLLGQGLPEAWLCDRAREMAARGWSDLARHAEMSTAPITPEVPVGKRSGLPEWCGECGQGAPAARLNARFRTLGELGSGEKCPRCHPDRCSAAAQVEAPLF